MGSNPPNEFFEGRRIPSPQPRIAPELTVSSIELLI